MSIDIIQQLKAANLRGRGGAGFPTSLKWEAVKNTPSSLKYIICNASEGDPQLKKDYFILKNHAEEVVQGIKIALDNIDHSKAYIYLKKDYYRKFKKPLLKLIKNLPIKLFKKPGGYLAGEETALLDAIEGKRPEPRLKPPYPSEAGLWGYPTLIDNVETFYHVAKIAQGKYKNERFYCLSGDIPRKGVFVLRENLTIKEILDETHNAPKSDFFIQAGGTLGEFFLPHELNQPINGLGSIVVYDKVRTNPLLLAKKIIRFALYQNCDKCTPCREGTYRLFEEFAKKEPNKKIINDILLVLEETTFCALGAMAGKSMISLQTKIIHD